MSNTVPIILHYDDGTVDKMYVDKDITELDLTDKNLVKVEISDLLALERLWLGGNNLTHVMFKNLPKLQYIDLCHNEITSLDNIVGLENKNLPKLEKFFIQKNPTSPGFHETIDWKKQYIKNSEEQEVDYERY